MTSHARRRTTQTVPTEPTDDALLTRLRTQERAITKAQFNFIGNSTHYELSRSDIQNLHRAGVLESNHLPPGDHVAIVQQRWDTLVGNTLSTLRQRAVARFPTGAGTLESQAETLKNTLSTFDAMRYEFNTDNLYIRAPSRPIATNADTLLLTRASELLSRDGNVEAASAVTPYFRPVDINSRSDASRTHVLLSTFRSSAFNSANRPLVQQAVIASFNESRANNLDDTDTTLLLKKRVDDIYYNRISASDAALYAALSDTRTPGSQLTPQQTMRIREQVRTLSTENTSAQALIAERSKEIATSCARLSEAGVKAEECTGITPPRADGTRTQAPSRRP